MLAPILPGITDRPEQLRPVVEAAFEAGATHVSPILLHLRPGVKEEYMGWLEREYPDLVPKYMSMYNRRSYAHESDRKALAQTVQDIKAAMPRAAPRPRSSRSQWRRPNQAPAPRARSEQMTLL